MNGRVVPGTNRGRQRRSHPLARRRFGPHPVAVEHPEASLTWADVTVLREAVRVADDPDWPLRHGRFVGVLNFD